MLKQKQREIIVVTPETVHPMAHVPTSKAANVFTISTLGASILFLLAFSGIEVGHILSYVVPLIISVLAANEIYKRWGIWHSIWVTCLGIFVFATGFGEAYMNHMLSLFASVQKVSLGGADSIWRPIRY